MLAGGLWKIAVDPNQLENAILNLAVNARDAMPEGGRLTIETANSYLDEAYAAANGDDIAARPIRDARGHRYRHRHEPRGDASTRSSRSSPPSRPAWAPGLGLSMVYGFVKQSGGHIKIYSELGEGTTIKLYFPRLDEQRELPEWT